MCMNRNTLKQNRSFLLLLPALAAALLINLALVDEYMLTRDHANLMSLLRQARFSAIYDQKTLTVRFTGHTATLIDSSGTVLTSLSLPTLARVNYDTIEGPDQVIFEAAMALTSPYNMHVHGGDFTFRSWLGNERGIWVHCTSLATEGWMSEEAKADTSSAR